MYAGGGDDEPGAVYVLFGKQGFGTTESLLSPDGSNGFVLTGEIGAGYCLAAAGDVNDDDYDDFVTGAPGLNGGKGRAYVIYGHAPPFSATAALADLMNGTAGTRIDPDPRVTPPRTWGEAWLLWVM